VRVAQVVASYQPSLGGVETHVRRVAVELARAGDEVTVLTHQPGGLPAEETIGPLRVLRFPLTVGLANYPLSLPLFGYLRAHASDFDILHAHSYHTLVGQAAVRTGLPFVFTPHYHGTGHTRLRALLHRLYRPVGGRLFAAADAVICVSAAERDLVAGDFRDAVGKVRVIPNGIDPRPVGVPRQRTAAGRGPAAIAVAGIGDAGPVVLAIGRLERYKHVDLIITACRALSAEVTLVVVGSGPDRPRLERLAGEGGSGCSVRFTGRVSDDELAELLAAATVVTSASEHEAFGLIVADGLAAGARVVASAIPAHYEVGRLAGADAPIVHVDPANTTQFAAALAGALAMGRPPAGRVRLPSWAEVAEQTRELYGSVAPRGRRPRSRELA
jgi:glycosyltransferase involved in cell wall biosynthesis